MAITYRLFVPRPIGTLLLLLATLSGVLHFMSITPANILGILLLSLVLFSDKLEEIVNASHRKGALPPATQGTQR